jgi:Protein of unknown function (DUF3551)
MKIITILSILVACGMAFQTCASAQGKTYPYCLESGDAGGGTTTNCAYETMAQCMASKSRPSDRCSVNPSFGGRR